MNRLNPVGEFDQGVAILFARFGRIAAGRSDEGAADARKGAEIVQTCLAIVFGPAELKIGQRLIPVSRTDTPHRMSHGSLIARSRHIGGLAAIVEDVLFAG